MTTMLDTSTNGKVRKSLASQIDRLDSMLDGLADAIPEVVADTMRHVAAQAVRDAVQAAVTEVLTNKDILAKLRAATMPAPSSTHSSRQRTSVRQRLTSLVQGARTCLDKVRLVCGAGMWQVKTGLGNLWRKTLLRLAALKERCRSVAQFKYHLLTALSIGVTVAFGAWFTGPTVSALLSGVGGFGATVAVQGWLCLRKAFGCLTSKAC